MTLTQTNEAARPSVETIQWNGLTWVYIEKPGNKEVGYLAQNYPLFHVFNLDDITSRIQIPKIDEYEDHLFTVLHFPVFDRESRVTLPSEIDSFIGENFVVTIHCSGDLKPLANLFKDCQIHEGIRQQVMRNGSGYLFYRIVDTLVDYCFPILYKVIDNVERVEDRVFSVPSPQTVHELMVIRRDIFAFRHIIRTEMPVIASLEHKELAFLGGNLDVYFGDLSDHLRKIWNTLEEYREIMDSISDAGNWLASHRMQEIMRVLTIFMSVLLPLSVVSGIWGMNVRLPMGIAKDGSWIGFAVLIALMIAISGGIIFFFRRRKWI